MVVFLQRCRFECKMSRWSMRLGCLVLAVLMLGLGGAQNEEGRRTSSQESSSSNSFLPEHEVPSAEEFSPLAVMTFSKSFERINKTGRLSTEPSVLPLVHSNSGVGRFRRSTTNGICAVDKRGLAQILDELKNMQAPSSMHSAQSLKQHDDNNCPLMESGIKQEARRLKEVISNMMNNRETDDHYDVIKNAYYTIIKTLVANISSIGAEVNQQYKPLFEKLVNRISLVQNNLIDSLHDKITLQAAYDKKKALHDSLRHVPQGNQSTNVDKVPPYYPPATCELPSTWLTGLLDILQETLRIIASSGGAIPSQSDTLTHTEHASYSCLKSMSLVRESIGHLKSNFKVLSSSADERAKKHAQQNSTYETEIGVLKKLIVDLRQTETQDWKRKLSKLQLELQSKTSDLNTAREGNENLRERIMNETVWVCIALIKRDEYQPAMQQLNELNSTEQLGNIVKGAYDNNVTNADHVLLFIRRLPRPSEFALGFEVLFDEMKRNGHLGSLQAMRLLIQILIAMTSHPDVDRDIQDKLERLKTNIIPHQHENIGDLARIYENITNSLGSVG